MSINRGREPQDLIIEGTRSNQLNQHLMAQTFTI